MRMRGPLAKINMGRLMGFATLHNDILLLQSTKTLATFIPFCSTWGSVSVMPRAFGRLGKCAGNVTSFWAGMQNLLMVRNQR